METVVMEGISVVVILVAVPEKLELVFVVLALTFDGGRWARL